MKSQVKTLLSFIFLFFLFTCQTEDETTPLKHQRIPGQIRTVDSEDIPHIVDKINSITGPRNERTYSSNDGAGSDILDNIDFSAIMEVIDTLSNANYTFNVDDKDNDPYTFVNLVVKDRLEGDIDTPYLLYYSVDSLARPDFALSGFSMEHFTGSVTKIYLNSTFTDREYSANLHNKSSIDDDCTLTTQFDAGSTGTGDNTNGSDGLSGGYSGVTFYWDCESEVVPVVDNNCDFEGQLSGQTITDPGCSSTSSTQYVLQTRCTLRAFWNGVASDCPEPETEDIGIILNTYTEEHAEARLSIEIGGAINNAIYTLSEQGLFPNGNIEWGELLEVLQMVFIDFGLIDVIPIIGEAHEFTEALKYFDNGDVRNGVLAMTGVIIGFIPAGKMVKALSRLLDIRKAIKVTFNYYRFVRLFKKLGVPYKKYNGSYLDFTRSKYRENLMAHTKIEVDAAYAHAHHVFPIKFESFWKKFGDDLNIDHPDNLAWWPLSGPNGHLKQATPYNNAWSLFFASNPNPSLNEIKAQAKKIMKEFNIPTNF